MFKLKTVGAVTLASLLLLSGCSSNNPEDEIEPVNNTLALRINPYHPERVYVECVAENVDRRVRSIILVFSLIVVPLVLILLWFRLSIF